MNEEIVVDFQLGQKSLVTDIHNNFSHNEIIESSGFSGTELVTVIISASVVAMDKILNFFLQKRKNLKETVIKIGKDEVSLSGFSDEEIQAFIASGSIAKIREQMGLTNE